MAPTPSALRIALSAAPVCAAALLFACQSDLPTMRDYGSPPKGSYWNPGLGVAVGQVYGSGYAATNNAVGGYASTPGGGSSTPPAAPVCPPSLQRCGVTISYPDPSGFEHSVELRGDWRNAETWNKGVAMTRVGDHWEATIPVPLNTKVQYKFVVDPVPADAGGAWVIDPQQPTLTDPGGNANNVFAGVASCANPTCEQDPSVPAGVFDWRDAVIYFAFVDRFFDSDGQRCSTPGASGPISSYLGGDWKGVEQKIPYLKQLGVNTLWLTVPVDNTLAIGQGVGGDNHMYSGYHGYWPTTLDQAEHCFASGTQTAATSQADLQHLVGTLHAQGMKVILDYGMALVHVDSPLWSGPNAHRDWFWPNDNGHGADCICGQSCSWDNDAKKCWFTSYLPHWNYNNQAALDYSVNTALSWITKAAPAGDTIDGFRLDAIKHVEDSWLTTLRSRVTSQVVSAKPQGSRFYMVGETFSYDPNYVRNWVDPQNKLDGQFDFPLRHELVRTVFTKQGGLDELKGFMDNNDSFYGASAIMSTFIGNHDLGRAIHMADDAPAWDEYSNGDKTPSWNNLQSKPLYGQPGNHNAYERLAVAFGLLFTNKGAPLIYYGDEIGLAGSGDPDNRRPMPFCGAANLQDAETIGRVCTPSDGAPSWTSDQTWLHDRVAQLLATRQAHVALRHGQRSTINVTADTWVYSMTTAAETVYVAVNRGDSAATISGLPTGALKEQLTGATITGGSDSVPPRQVRIYVP